MFFITDWFTSLPRKTENWIIDLLYVKFTKIYLENQEIIEHDRIFSKVSSLLNTLKTHGITADGLTEDNDITYSKAVDNLKKILKHNCKNTKKWKDIKFICNEEGFIVIQKRKPEKNGIAIEAYEMLKTKDKLIQTTVFNIFVKT
jgi:hypothetical protein